MKNTYANGFDGMSAVSEADFKAIDERRARHGISQSELCQAANVHVTTYYKIVKGRTGLPQRRTLSRLRRALEALIEGGRA